MPEMDGATAAIRRQFPQIRVIALTSYREDELVESRIVTCSRACIRTKQMSHPERRFKMAHRRLST